MNSIKSFFGFSAENISHAERIVSAVGGFVGIFFIIIITYWYTGTEGAVLIVPSMGASAVLVFAVPHGKLSQPWALLGGHAVSAVVGVACYQLVPDPFVAAALAVGIAIGAMHYLGCIHPPGGATALAAVIGGDAIHSLGYTYLFTPIMINTLVIFLTAILFNAFFPWRRYPASLMKPREEVSHAEPGAFDMSSINQDDLDYAMRKMDLLVDITVEDLVRIYALASRHSQAKQLQPTEVMLDHYYSNGLYGKLWQVRHIIDESPHPDPSRDKVIYKIVAGHGRRSTGSCTREEFAAWARYEVERHETHWVRPNGEQDSAEKS